MALSSEQKRIITELMEGYIANIPVTTLADFQVLTDGLNLMTETDTVVVTESMQNAFNVITDYMSSEVFSFDGEDEGDEFLSLCKQVISEREHYFSGLSDADKEAYIRHQSGESIPAERHDSEDTQGCGMPGVVSSVFSSAYNHLDAFLVGAIAYGQQLDRGDTSFLLDVMGLGLGEFCGSSELQTASETASSTRYRFWEKGFDNWESGSMENRDISGAIHRQRNYALTHGEVIKNLYLSEYNSGELQLTATVLSSHDRKSHVLDSEQCVRFQAALNQVGITEDMPCVAYFPKPEQGVINYTPNVPHLVIKGPAEEIIHLVCPVFGAIESLEGEGSVPFEMREEIRASLEQLMVSREAFEEKAGI